MTPVPRSQEIQIILRMSRLTETHDGRHDEHRKDQEHSRHRHRHRHGHTERDIEQEVPRPNAPALTLGLFGMEGDLEELFAQGEMEQPSAT